MVTGVLLVTLGAVKNPLLEIVPALAHQVTAVSAVPLMLAVNCCCACDAMMVLLGDSDMEELLEAPEELELCDAVPQAIVMLVMQSKSERARKFEIEFLSQQRFVTIKCPASHIEDNLGMEDRHSTS